MAIFNSYVELPEGIYIYIQYIYIYISIIYIYLHYIYIYPLYIYPLYILSITYIYIYIHYSWFTYQKWWFSMVMLVYQRVSDPFFSLAPGHCRWLPGVWVAGRLPEQASFYRGWASGNMAWTWRKTCSFVDNSWQFAYWKWVCPIALLDYLIYLGVLAFGGQTGLPISDEKNTEQGT